MSIFIELGSELKSEHYQYLTSHYLLAISFLPLLLFLAFTLPGGAIERGWGVVVLQELEGAWSPVSRVSRACRYGRVRSVL